MSAQIPYGKNTVPLKLLVSEPRLEGGDPSLTARYGEKIAIIAPAQLATANLSTPTLAQAILFAQWAINDAEWAAPDFVAEYIALLKMTKSLRSKTLDALLQNLRGEPVLIPVQAPTQQHEGGILDKIRGMMRR